MLNIYTYIYIYTFLPCQGRGGTASMCLNQVRPPVGSTFSAHRVPTACCRPGVSRVGIREGGRSSRGDRMGRSTSSELGSSIRWLQKPTCLQNTLGFIVCFFFHGKQQHKMNTSLLIKPMWWRITARLWEPRWRVLARPGTPLLDDKTGPV